MRMRTTRCLILGTCTVAGLAALWLWWPNPDRRPPLASLSASISASPAKIVVGRNAHVSLANAEIEHMESVIAADPRDPARLFISAMFEPLRGKDTNKLVGYYSHDRGLTWSLALDQRGDPAEGFGDPTATFGPDGSIYLAYIRNKSAGANLIPGSPDGRIEFVRSTDSCKTWHEPTNIPQWYDRPWIAIDPSAGPYRSRLYCIVKGEGALAFVSSDQGKTFSQPCNWRIDLGKYSPDLRPGNPVVLSDSTVVMHYDLRTKDYSSPPLIPVLVSHDGGESFQNATPVNTGWRDKRVTTGNCRIFPQMAADTQSEEYRDRLYCVWEDGGGINQQRIFLSTSADSGQTWSTPLVLSEQPTGPTDEGDYSTFMPSITVNKQGVVAVSWYDRRGLPRRDKSGDTNVGCNVRLRLSLDGGSTWLPSVQVNEKTIQVRCGVQGGDLKHTAGIAADAEGEFHPAWIDNRTGKRQVYTATVKVMQENADFPRGAQDQKGVPPALPSSVPVSSEKIKISIGPNVLVSGAKDELQHRECVIAADPTNASRLFAAAIYMPADAKRPVGADGVVGFFSHDGGKTWQLSFANQDGVCYEPAAAFGPDGSLYFVRQHFTLEEFSKPKKAGEGHESSLRFSLSTNGGKTFEQVATIDRQLFLDRPWLAVDCTHGKNRGRLYCCVVTGNKPVLFTSSNRGKSFAAPLVWPTKPLLFHTGSPVILSDGTLVLMYGEFQSILGEGVRQRVFVLRSQDGGGSLQETATVTRNWHSVFYFWFPQLAADQSLGKYRDRVYAVWTDRAVDDGEPRILFSLSKDKGRSWTDPQHLSEQPTAAEQDYAAYLPAVAVNKDGVVAVSWYDRRGLPRGKPQEFPPGWNVRLRVSTDAGETWHPSVQVNEAPRKAGKTPYNEVRDTAGLTADANGNFHPVWIDDRTGKRQVWTTTIIVGQK